MCSTNKEFGSKLCEVGESLQGEIGTDISGKGSRGDEVFGKRQRNAEGHMVADFA